MAKITSQSDNEPTYEKLLRSDPVLALREASSYFMAEGKLYQTLRDLTARLETAGIPYAVIGGIAMAQHGYVRMTEDIDLLLTVSGLEDFRRECLGRGYVPAFPGARKSFRSVETRVRVEVLTTGEYPGDGLPKPVRFPDPESASVEVAGIRVIALEKLVELKLASGATAAHRRRDLADVQDLIQTLDLALDFAEQIDPSVRPLYRQLWQEVDAARSRDASDREG